MKRAIDVTAPPAATSSADAKRLCTTDDVPCFPIADLPEKSLKSLFSHLSIESRNTLRLLSTASRRMVDDMMCVRNEGEQLRLDFSTPYDVEDDDDDEEGGLSPHVYDLSVHFGGGKCKVRVEDRYNKAARKAAPPTAYPHKIEACLARVVERYAEHITSFQFGGRMEDYIGHEPKDYLLPCLALLLTRLPRLNHIDMRCAYFLPKYDVPRIERPLTVEFASTDSYAPDKNAMDGLNWLRQCVDVSKTKLLFRVNSSRCHDQVWVLSDALSDRSMRGYPLFHTLDLEIDVFPRLLDVNKVAKYCQHLEITARCGQKDFSPYPDGKEEEQEVAKILKKLKTIKKLTRFELDRVCVEDKDDVKFWTRVLKGMPCQVTIYREYERDLEYSFYGYESESDDEEEEQKTNKKEQSEEEKKAARAARREKRRATEDALYADLENKAGVRIKRGCRFVF